MSPCRSRLAEIAAFKPLPSITGPGDCTATDVVALDAVLLADRHRIALSPQQRCAAQWRRRSRTGYATMWRLQSQSWASRCAAWKLSISFDCRRRNGITDAKISEHGRANALDVRAFKLANGAAIQLTDANVTKSLREKLRQSACARFSTVLGNGADGYHDSHVHLDLLERSNNYKICQWEVLDLTETAALAAKKAAAATASNPAVVKVGEIPLPPPMPGVSSSGLSMQPQCSLGRGSPPPAFQSVRSVIEGHTLTCSSLDAASSFRGICRAVGAVRLGQ